MKTFKNLITTIDVSEDSKEKTKYVDLAKACVNNIPNSGLDVKQMSARLAVMKKLDKGGAEIKLEDAEAETLKTCASAMRWLVMHDDVVKFLKAVEKL